MNLSEKKYNTIFVSLSDHYSGTPNHGLLQMFLYFKNVLKEDCAFICTQDQHFKDMEHSYDISHLGGDVPLGRQINLSLSDLTDERTWKESVQYENLLNPRTAPPSDNIDNILNNLPDHKNIILGDKSDINEYVLTKILDKFQSKLILVTMVHNAHTGKCAFPQGQYKCNKYKYKEGCYNCPDMRAKAWDNMKMYDDMDGDAKNKMIGANFQTGTNNFPYHSFKIHRNFIQRHRDKIFLNAGSTYSLEQADESFLYKDVKKQLIPLKTVKETASSKEEIIDLKNKNKELATEFINNNDPRLPWQKWKEKNNVDMSKIKNICFWSSFDPTSERKGMRSFIESLYILRQKYMTKEQYEETLFVIAGIEEKAMLIQGLFPEETKFIFTGLLTPDGVQKFNLASDLFCCTTLEDAGPRTVPEAVSCGTPVVSFDQCIAKDLITDKNGRLVKTGDADSFAKGMSEVLLASKEDKEKMFYESIKMYEDFYSDEKICEKWKKVLN